MRKNNNKSALVASLSVLYASWNLLHMERNGLLETSTVNDTLVSIGERNETQFSQAVKELEQKAITALRLASTPKTNAQASDGGARIVNRFFATGLHQEGVVPPLLFACMLYCWFVESEQEVPHLLKALADPKLYDDVFCSIEEAGAISWSDHMGAAMAALGK